MASIVIDAPNPHLAIGPEIWSIVIQTRYFGGSTIFPLFANDTTGLYGNLIMPFQGTSITFYGNTRSSPSFKWFLASLDGGTPYNTSYDDPSPPTSLQWYQSPILSDGSHTVNITHMDGTSVDFMVVTAGPTTPLLTQTLIVDDDDSDIIYSGSWLRNSSRYTSNTNPSEGLPYGNSTHQATSAGPSATFRFRGTSVAVYSIFDYSRLGALSVTYTLDGFPLLKSYDVGPSTPEYQQGTLTIENTLMYSNSSLASGDHTLVLNVTTCNNQIFALDYILYSPSFNTIADKPNYGTTSTGSSTLPGSSESGSSQVSSTGKSSHVGAIVGGVIGGIAALLIAVFIIICRKRMANRYSSSPAATALTRSSHTAEPYTILATGQNLTSTHGPPPQVIPQQKSRITDAPIPRQPPSDPAIRSTSSAYPLRPQMGQTSPILAAQQRNYQVWSGDGNEGESNFAATVFRSRMQRLQDLILELNQEISENGEESSYALELRGRIAELTREDIQGSEIVPQRRIVPPSYEATRASQ